MGSFFTWWHSATLGTRVSTWLRGKPIGTDDQGNRYYEGRAPRANTKLPRRWVIYNGPVEASRIPPEWHAWIHHITVEPPTVAPLHRQSWERDHRANPTGTAEAYRPKGSVAGPGVREKNASDYEPWTPEDATP